MTASNRRFIRLAALLAAATALSSCAARLRLDEASPPERLLPPGALVYARLDGPVLAETAYAVLGEDTAASAAAVLDRTDSIVLAVRAEAGAAAPSLYGVAKGRYPTGAAAMSLSFDSSWKRKGAVWTRKADGTSIAFADGGGLLLGTGSLDGLVAAMDAPNRDPIAAVWKAAWTAPVAIYIPDPMAVLREALPLGDSDIPLKSMMLSAAPKAGLPESVRYETILGFEFASEKTATVFAPLCRVFFYAMASALWPDRSATVLDEARWDRSGALVTVSGVHLDAASLAAFAGLAAR